jgi:hypothetical protein
MWCPSVAFRARVPKASINEYRQLEMGKIEVGAARNILRLLDPSFYTGGGEHTFDRYFRGFISAATDLRHSF